MQISNLAKDVILFFSLLFGLSILCFFPSFEISKVEFINVDNIPKIIHIKPGHIHVSSFPKKINSLQLNNSPLSYIQSINKYFFIAGVYGGTTKLLHGQFERNQKWLEGILFPPVQKVFRSLVEVESAPLDSGNELRLPASVQKKMETADDEKKRADRMRLLTALLTDLPREEWACWQKPVNSKVTSAFARPRTLPSGRSYYHSGVDLRAQTNTPILSAGPGTVVYAGHMTVPGNNVILSHGNGLFSRYMHLEKVNVAIGQRVPAGKSIGLAGSTGRVEAPHLHWEVVWKGNHADPLQFLQDWEQICDPESAE